jgi:hypothetical protein
MSVITSGDISWSATYVFIFPSLKRGKKYRLVAVVVAVTIVLKMLIHC